MQARIRREYDGAHQASHQMHRGTVQVSEDKPAVEFGEQSDENDQSNSWMGLGIAALIFGAITVALAIPGNWEEYIVGNESRRYRGLVNIVEFIGYWPILIIVAAIAVVAGVAAVTRFVAAQSHTES